MFACFVVSGVVAQDSTVFRGYLYNEDYKVYMKIDFYKNNVTVPGQEVFGNVPGYFGALRDSRKWLVTNVVIENDSSAKLMITNDYGSEDLEATFSRRKDGTYVLRQTSGSRLKIVVNRKWVKIPIELILKISSPKLDEW